METMVKFFAFVLTCMCTCFADSGTNKTDELLITTYCRDQNKKITVICGPINTADYAEFFMNGSRVIRCLGNNCGNEDQIVAKVVGDIMQVNVSLSASYINEMMCANNNRNSSVISPEKCIETTTVKNVGEEAGEGISLKTALGATGGVVIFLGAVCIIYCFVKKKAFWLLNGKRRSHVNSHMAQNGR